MHLAKIKLLLILSIMLLTGCAAGVVTVAAVGGAAASPDRRTFGTITDDQTTQVKAQLALNKDSELNHNSHIATLSYNNAILLVGQAPTSDLRAKAFDIVSRISPVERVYNEIEVEEPTKFSQRTKDAWITTRVKFATITDKEVGPGRLSVITENGVVYLMGMVNKEEAYKACELARRVPGVKRVVKLFDDIDDVPRSPLS